MTDYTDILSKEYITNDPYILRVVHTTDKKLETDLNLCRYDSIVTRYEGGEVHAQLYLNIWPVYRTTRACDVIDDYGKDRFIRRHAKRRYAYPTTAEAWNSFIKRTRWRIVHADWALTQAKIVEAMINGKRETDFIHR